MLEPQLSAPANPDPERDDYRNRGGAAIELWSGLKLQDRQAMDGKRRQQSKSPR